MLLKYSLKGRNIFVSEIENEREALITDRKSTSLT
jgi:hypothetical protein